MTVKVSKRNIKAELLAPAGSKESFYAAIKAGADAVYMAGQKFGARAYAGNFTDEEIVECEDIAHLYGKKIYLTVNTLVKEKEFDELKEFAGSKAVQNCDGLIIQDLGVASFFRENYPDIPIHASTQMSVTGAGAAKFLQDNGFCRVVPARECSFEEIKDIYEKTGMEIECFIHGAMCYSYSGQCLFSSILGGRSGNRGRCAQPCRLAYRLKDSNKDTETYPLSLKDMCTLEILPKILESGVVSLKVEGRMKPPEYVAGVISIYRKYLDLYYSGEEYKVSKEDLKKLSQHYVRGSLSHGYYDRKNSADMVTVFSHGYDSEDGGFIEEIKKKYINAQSTEYLPKIKISFNASFKLGEKAYLNAYANTSDGREAYSYAEGEEVSKALKSAIGEEDVRKSLKKLGNTAFETSDDQITVDIDDEIFYSLKGINELRRKAVDELFEALKCPVLKNNDSFSCKTNNNAAFPGHLNIENAKFSSINVLVNSLEQFKTLGDFTSDSKNDVLKRIYIDESLLKNSEVIQFAKQFPSHIEIFAALVQIRRKGEDTSFIRDLLKEKIISGILVRNLEDLSQLQNEDDLKVITDHNLYCYNKLASGFINLYSDECTVPLELSNPEVYDLLDKNSVIFERVIYGKAPLMITANCVRKTLKTCSHNGGYETIIDRKGVAFKVKTDCDHCLNIIYNSVPLLLQIPEKRNYSCRIEFTDETKDLCMKILDHYLGSGADPDIQHTNGWNSRPVL